MTRHTKLVLAGVILLVFADVQTYAGVIGFDPEEVTIDPSVDPTVFTMEMYVASAEAELFDSVDVVVGSDDLGLIDFADAGWCQWPPCWAPDDQTYRSGIRLEWVGTPQQSGLVLGTLTVEAAGLPNGTYWVDVDSQRSALGAPPEPLVGSGLVHVIPEPGTVLLVGLGVVGLLRRRPAA